MVCLLFNADSAFKTICVWFQLSKESSSDSMTLISGHEGFKAFVCARIDTLSRAKKWLNR